MQPAQDWAESDAFFARLPVLRLADETFAAEPYQSAPDDWLLCVTDIENSTGAIARGQHKTVNFAAAAGLAALKNVCAPVPIPVLFGGDGCVAMAPASRADAARRALARVKSFVARDLGLNLRVGAATVRDIRAAGAQVKVARYEPTPGNAFGVFQGGGVQICEAALKGRGYPALAAAMAMPGALDDGAPPDLDGLSCRWSELASKHGQMMSVIVVGARDAGALYRDIVALAARQGDPRPVRFDNLAAQWPPKGFWLGARRGRGSLLLSAAKVMAETLIAYFVIRGRRKVGAFDTEKYMREIVSNTDFCKHDDTLSFVIDCAPGAVAAIQSFLQGRAARDGFRFGLHLSPTALMTCLVQSPEAGLHVHFVDGGDGGYTSAARNLRQD